MNTLQGDRDGSEVDVVHGDGEGLGVDVVQGDGEGLGVDASFYEGLVSEGWVLLATGNEPGWRVVVSAEGDMEMSTLEGKVFGRMVLEGVLGGEKDGEMDEGGDGNKDEVMDGAAYRAMDGEAGGEMVGDKDGEMDGEMDSGFTDLADRFSLPDRFSMLGVIREAGQHPHQPKTTWSRALCMDSMSGEVFDYKVHFQWGKMDAKGCGRVLKNGLSERE